MYYAYVCMYMHGCTHECKYTFACVYDYNLSIIVYTTLVFPPKGGTMALLHPLVLKFMLKNTD